ncbi:MAG TPA: hypothetical protein VGL56_07675 [Fimbriimonadaceae bacterium]|jgi:hypothetical protein
MKIGITLTLAACALAVAGCGAGAPPSEAAIAALRKQSPDQQFKFVQGSPLSGEQKIAQIDQITGATPAQKDAWKDQVYPGWKSIQLHPYGTPGNGG